MADAFTKYQQELARRKGTTGGIGGVFQEEGPGMTPDPRTLNKMKRIKLSSELNPKAFSERGLQSKLLKTLRDDELSKIMPPSGIEQALRQVKFAGSKTGLYDEEKAPVTLLEKKNLERSRQGARDLDTARIEAMPDDSPAFAESPLDAIANMIKKAEGKTPSDSDQATAQNIIVKKEKDARAEDFRAKEKALVENFGSGDQTLTVEQSDEIFKNTYDGALADYIESVRGETPDTREQTIQQYKDEFAKATGVDVSGKVDKSSALMAMGLAMMQNKAGKGFNVANALSAVGAAGEKALPVLEKAKDRARQGALAGGKYALQTRSSDRAVDEVNKEKARTRSKLWVYKKGGKGTEFANFDDGEFVDLNKFELDKLINNKEFEDQYEFISGSDRLSILEKRREGVDLGDMWNDYERISLIGGKADEMPPELQVLAAPADANYKGITPTRYKLAEDPRTVARRFMEYQKSINSGAEKMESLLKQLEGGITIPKQFLSSANKILVAFGIGETSDIEDAKRLLKNIAIDEATAILKESGKTLSDNDRKLVERRVGEISWGSADLEQIRKQLKDIYQLTVLKPQENLDRAVGWLETNAGIQFGAAQGDMPTQAELDAMNKLYGTNYTMDDYKEKAGT